MAGEMKFGRVIGTGAAINVELGFIPDYVELTNETDGDLITRWNRGRHFTFTGGGTQEVRAGDTLIGATSGAIVVVREVLTLTSGSWAAGTAAGTFIADEKDVTGTPTTTGEKMYRKGGVGTDDLDTTSGLANIEFCQAVSGSVANATGNSAISSYHDATGVYRDGFTVGLTVSESGKTLRYSAFRNS